jgi:hypothetical protein
MQVINQKILLLQIVNILEPVTDEELYASTEKFISREDIIELLGSLKEDGFVVKEKDQYRVTLSGLTLSVSKKSSIQRDISRMKYLVASTRQRGGESVGR